jgi:hypothetical protein
VARDDEQMTWLAHELTSELNCKWSKVGSHDLWLPIAEPTTFFFFRATKHFDGTIHLNLATSVHGAYGLKRKSRIQDSERPWHELCLRRTMRLAGNVLTYGVLLIRGVQMFTFFLFLSLARRHFVRSNYVYRQ